MAELLPFRPDQGEQASGTPMDVFMLGPQRYGPRPTLAIAPGAGALPAAPRGAYGGYLPNGTFKGFAATSTKVYTLGSDYTFTALSPTFTVPTDDDEAMAQFGVFMLASNTTDGMYAYNMDTPAGLNAVSGAPAARYIFAAYQQVVALGSGGSALYRVKTSAFGDHTNWTSKGASTQDLNDGGAFTGGGSLSNRISVLFQLRAVRRMVFGNAGGGALFALEDIVTDVGCVHPRAQVVYGGKAWFLHTNGFWETDGQSVRNIGAGKVNNWFLARCPDLKKVYFSVDPKNTIVRIRYKSSGVGSDSIFTDILDYNWVADEFIPGIETTSAIFRMGSPGYTLDTISSAFGVLDAWSAYPLDSAFWQGGNLRLAGLNSAFKFGFFDGTSAAASIESVTEGDGRRKIVNWCEPLTDDAAATVQLKAKEKLSDTPDWGTAASIKPSGRVPLRGAGKWQRYKINHAAGATWTGDAGLVTAPYMQVSGFVR